MATSPSFGPLAATRVLLRYARPWRTLVVVAAVAVIVRVVADLVQRTALKDLIETGLNRNDRDAVLRVVLIMVGAVVVSTAAHVYRDVLQARLSALMTNEVRERFFLHIQQLSSGYFAKTKTIELMGRFNGDIGAIETAFGAMMTGAAASIAIVFAVGALALLDPRLAIVCATAVPFMILGPRILTPRAIERGHTLKRAQRNVSNTVHEAIVTQAVVRAYQLGDRVTEEFRCHQERLQPVLIRFNVLNALAERTPAIALQAMGVAVLVVGGWYVLESTLTVGALVAYYAVVQSLSTAVREIAGTLPVLIRTAVSVRRVEEILDLPVEVPEAERAVALMPLRNEIRLRAVQFGYESDRVILDVLDLRYPAGGTTAFVGGSGSGKTSALRLILRSYDPAAGDVTFDGINLRAATKASLYSQTAVVFQEGFLLDTDIRTNIRAGRADASDADVERAARDAEVHDAIMSLPRGYETPVRQFGKSLSAGERQRVALARAMIRDPRLLILDEATSALDPTTEASIQATLDRVSRGRTVISVTHRLSTAMHADRIVVFEGGRVVEQGRHDELVAHGGAYAGLWEKQTGVTLAADDDAGLVRPEWLRRISIFRQLEEPLLREAAGLFVIERVAAGRTIITRGESGRRFYVIAHGTVAVLAPGEDGEEREVTRLHEGDYFGEIALLRLVPRTATVASVTDCVFATLRGSQFRRLFDVTSDARRRLEEAMGSRMTNDITGPV